MFVEREMQDRNWATKNIVEFLMQYKERYGRLENTGSTIRYISNR
jgi:hypothetical protein